MASFSHLSFLYDTLHWIVFEHFRIGRAAFTGTFFLTFPRFFLKYDMFRKSRVFTLVHHASSTFLNTALLLRSQSRLSRHWSSLEVISKFVGSGSRIFRYRHGLLQ